jgi:hypothetical protein
MSGLIVSILLHESLSTEGLYNEIISEGCVKWVKVRNIGKGFSTLDLTLVVLLSLTRVNLWSKNGSARSKSSNIIIRFRDQLSARSVDETVCSEITSTVNTITEGNLRTTHYINTYKKIINSKRGNPGNGI